MSGMFLHLRQLFPFHWSGVTPSYGIIVEFDRQKEAAPKNLPDINSRSAMLSKQSQTQKGVG